MIKIRIAELNVLIHNIYPYCESFCAAYRAEFDTADIEVAVSEEEVQKEMADGTGAFPVGYYEVICVYRKIALCLPQFGGFVFHASVVECDGKAYAFAAPSGTGKSTHTRLWLKVFGDRARVINGDKPIFRLTEKGWYAYGTPWQGKEHWGANAAAPLQALCFLTRAEQNRIEPLGDEEAVGRLFHQVLLPSDAATADRFLTLLDDLITHTPTYLLGCNMNDDAALVAFSGMQKEN
ncbi:MAG: hypothetical protein E7644_05895 [Ruminococcaceae bacterium]|nr:hypothetical protein [Oscillospiraceae bacterium]